MSKRYKATNISWDIDMDEILEKLDTMSVEEAVKALKCSKIEKIFLTMSKEDRDIFALSQIHHNVVTAAEFLGIPTEVEIPEEIDNDDEDFEELVSVWLSDTYGYCHEGFVLEEIPARETLAESIKSIEPDELMDMLSPEQQRYIYDQIRMDNIAKDVVNRIHDAHTDIINGRTDEDLREEIGDQVAINWVENDDYDCNRDYWSNIDSLIEEVAL